MGKGVITPAWHIPVPAQVLKDIVPLLSVQSCVSFVVSRAAVTTDEATIGKRCLHFTQVGKIKLGLLQLNTNHNCKSPCCSSAIIYYKNSVKMMKKWCTYQWGFKVRHDGRAPRGRHHRINRVLLLRTVHLLHVHWWAILGLRLHVWGVHARVHTAVAILTKECVNSLNTGLRSRGWSDMSPCIKEDKLHCKLRDILSIIF